MPRITDVRVVTCRPTTENLVLVRVEVEGGLHGWGDATFTQRHLAVVTYIEQYLRPLLLGRDAANIEELWRLMHQNSYWRHGPVSNNAMSGVDLAFWDLAGKMAHLPVYRLLGGKYRPAAPVYRHAQGADGPEILQNVRRLVAEGARHVRIQVSAGAGLTTGLQAQTAGYGGHIFQGNRPDRILDGPCIDAPSYIEEIDAVLAEVRREFGQGIELLHDVHSRLMPSDAIQLAKRLERHRMFFLEDPLPPEQLHWLARLRQQSAIPIAIGELFVHPAEWVGLIDRQELDFVRMHISAVGGLTMARKIAAHAEMHDVRTAWHCPKDIAPFGVAANLALDVSCPNFGIQEFAPFTDPEREIFSGLPELREGHLYPTEQPGWGIEVSESAAARYPARADVIGWTQVRAPDGGLIRP